MTNPRGNPPTPTTRRYLDNSTTRRYRQALQIVCVVLLFALALPCCATRSVVVAPVPERGPKSDTAIATRVSGQLQLAALDELSGLAASHQHRGVFWAINDSGNDPVLYALDASGEALGALKVPVVNQDWEDLASFSENGQAWLVIADTGDNLRRRRDYQLHFIAEPSTLTGARVTVERSVVFRFEGGPSNVEAMAVSVRDRSIYLVAKAARRPRLFRLPLDSEAGQSAGQPLIARQVARLASLPATAADPRFEVWLAGRILLQPTAMDINDERRLAVISNYRHAYVYRRNANQSWPQALSAKPRVASSFRLRQSEAAAISNDAYTLLIGSEGSFAPLLSVAVPAQVQDGD